MPFEGPLPLALLERTPPALRGRLVRAWLRAGETDTCTARQVDAMLRVALGRRPSAQVRLGGGTIVRRRYDHLERVPPGAEVCPSVLPWGAQPLGVGGSLRLPSGWVLSAQRASQPFELPHDQWCALVDTGPADAPLVVRPVRLGDRIQPLGMIGHRKLQDVFTDRKVPAVDRHLWPAVECRGEIIWVPGLVRGAGAVVTTATHTAVRLHAARAGIAGPEGLC